MIVYPPAGPPTRWTVICLCAEWCDSCCGYRQLFEQRAAHADDARHIWVDIEDEADFLGGLDIETFPTLLVLYGDQPRFFGPVLPQVEVIDAMLRTMDPAAESSVDIAPDDEAAVCWLAQQARRAR